MSGAASAGLSYHWLTAPSHIPPDEVKLVNQASHAVEPFVGLLALRGSTEVREKRILFLVSLFKCIGFAYRSKSRKCKDEWTAGIAFLSWLALRRLVPKTSILAVLAKLLIPVQLLSWGLEHIDGHLGIVLRTLWVATSSLAFELFEKAVRKYNPKVKLRDFPVNSTELEGAWVSRCLKEKGVVGEDNVVSVTNVMPLSGVVKGEGDTEVPQGFVGETVRIHVEYGGPKTGVQLPQTLVAKFSTTRMRMRMQMRLVNVALREAQFYTAVGELSLRTLLRGEFGKFIFFHSFSTTRERLEPDARNSHCNGPHCVWHRLRR